jgi:formate--tetrahydrofolate ligase
MAILCLAKDYLDLGKRMSNMVVAFTFRGQPVLAKSLQAVGAMQVLLRDAIHPNLVQTLEGTPTFVHAGPFANIAHGANSAIATRMALKLADYVVTEAGFGTDLGAEKFFHIKCRISGLRPQAVVIVATAKAVAYHGGFTEKTGLANLGKHIENIRLFGIDPVVAINRFPDDRPQALKKIITFCGRKGVEAVVSDHFRKGGEGAIDLAEAAMRCVEKNRTKKVRFLYQLNESLRQKIQKVARLVYGAKGVDFDRGAETDLELLTRHGFGKLPVCIAKTPKSLSDVASLKGRPRNFRVTVQELRISAGAGFVVAICGNILTMPGLPKKPAAIKIKVLPSGRPTGLS